MVFGQADPTVAPNINAFNLSADNLGAVANAVNLFTGSVNLPMNLASLPSKNGLSIDVSIFYNSNVRNQVDIHNLEAPTGVLGLGWSLPTSQIVVDNKMTGTREDDEYYFVDGGASSKLICVGINGGTRSYKVETFQNWIITYTAGQEKWEIIKDDGVKYIFGDQASGRNTVQWIVKWGNWIGNSALSTGQQRQGLVWSISEIVNLIGDRIDFTYENVENRVGSSGLFHTEASYLRFIEDSWGNEVELIYGNKAAGEFVEPHTEAVEPDAYQERYEKRFLEKLKVTTYGVFAYEIQLGYAINLLGAGNLTKRLLTSITKISHLGNAISGPSFSYVTTGFVKGILNSITLPTGGSVNFTYHPTGLDIAKSRLDRNVTAPSGYKEPRVFVEDDYTVVTWRQLNGTSHDNNPRPVQTYVYQWDGGWKEKPLGSVGNVKMLDYEEQDFQVATSKNHFALLRPVYGSTSYMLYIYHKDERVPGEWLVNSYNINLDSHDDEKEKLLVGDNFVAVSNGKGKLFRYVWNGYSWNSSVVTSSSTHKHYTTSGSNYIIHHDTRGEYLTDFVEIHYLDELRNWQYYASNQFNSGPEDSYWHAGNNFAVLTADNAYERIYQINENYSLSPITLNFDMHRASNVYISGGYLVSFIHGTTMRSVGFNGNSWIDGGDKSFYNKMKCSFGENIIQWESDGISPTLVGHIKEYNPNMNTWKSDVNYSFTYDPVVWNPSIMGNNVYVLSKDYYFRNPNGSWVDGGDIYYTPGTDRLWPGRTRMGPNFFLYEGDTPWKLYVQFFKNNSLSTLHEVNSKTFTPRYSLYAYSKYMPLAGNNSFVTTSNSLNFLSCTSMTLHRVMDEKFSGFVKDYPVVKIEVNDGIKSRPTSFDYVASNATWNPQGGYAQYNKVITVEGSSNPTLRPYGWVENSFFNLLSETELGDTFPKESPSGNANAYYKLLTGSPYRTRAYDPTSVLVAESNTMWNVSYIVANNGTTGLEWMFIPRVYKSIDKRDNIEVQTINGYDITTKQLTYQRVLNKHASGENQLVDNEYTYAWQVYPDCLAKNILNPIVQVKRDINGSQYTESYVTRWKNWMMNYDYGHQVPMPADSYSWLGTGSHTFTVWDVAQSPSDDWRFLSKVSRRHSYSGVPIEEVSNGDQANAKVLNSNGNLVLGDVSNSSSFLVRYYGFEEATTDFSNDAKCGLKSSTTSLTVYIPATGIYKLTYWKKSTADWELVEQVTSSNVTIGGSGMLIDEVRLHPLKARMTTYSYDQFGNLITVCDPNNVISYKEYDDFNRPKAVRDQDENIILHTYYNIKN